MQIPQCNVQFTTWSQFNVHITNVHECWASCRWCFCAPGTRRPAPPEWTASEPRSATDTTTNTDESETRTTDLQLLAPPIARVSRMFSLIFTRHWFLTEWSHRSIVSFLDIRWNQWNQCSVLSLFISLHVWASKLVCGLFYSQEKK